MSLTLLLALAGCSPPETAPVEEAKPESTCPVTLETLPGSTWIHLKPQPAGPDKPNPMARIRFSDNAGALVAKYTAGSLSDAYDYTCSSNGKLVTCLEADIHAAAWCKAWASTHDQKCDPVALAQATGLPQADLEKVAEGVNKELAALKGEEKEQQKKSDNNPNNKIRGKFMVAVDPGTCKMTLVDKYQTMVDGKVNEYENVLGTSKFEQTKEDYVFETCKDVDSAWAPAPDDPNSHAAVQGPGTIKFAAILQKDQKGKGSCTYTADIYKDWIKVQADVPTTEDKKYGPRWDTQVAFTEPGRHTVYFDRYKVCDGGAKEKIGITCALVRVE